LVRPGITGLLADPEDPKQFSENIVQLLEDTEARLRLRRHCSEVAAREYNSHLYINRHIALYQDVLKSFPASRN
jgi:glycosyltransferase involved in cell wall biosynthesis